MLGNHPAWFGRGPSGHLLGPYRTSSACGAAVLGDIRDADQEGIETWAITGSNRAADMRAYAVHESMITNEPDFPTYRILMDSEGDLYAVAGPEGVIEEFWAIDPVEASNKASEARIAFTAGV